MEQQRLMALGKEKEQSVWRKERIDQVEGERNLGACLCFLFREPLASKKLKMQETGGGGGLLICWGPTGKVEKDGAQSPKIEGSLWWGK